MTGLPVAEPEFALEGLTQIAGKDNRARISLEQLDDDWDEHTPEGFAALYLQHLPQSLETLTLEYCHRSPPLSQVTFPSNLRSLTFESGFNQRLERVALVLNLTRVLKE